MSGIEEFLLARIAEDEATARAANDPDQMRPWGDVSPPGVAPEDVVGYLGGTWGEHCVAWGPLRVLRECAAKRAIVTLHASVPATYPDLVDLRWRSMPFGCPICHFNDNIQFGYGPCETVLTLARIWSEHPDFDPAWAES